MRIRHSLFSAALIALPVAVLPMASSAANTTATFPVTITITTACTFGSATASALDFGSRGLLDANFDGSTNLTVTCSNSFATSVQLDGGGNSVGGQRRMGNAGQFVNYDLYTDAPGGTAWGIGATNPKPYTGTGLQTTVTVYGRVPPQPTPTAGAYTDTVTATFAP